MALSSFDLQHFLKSPAAVSESVVRWSNSTKYLLLFSVYFLLITVLWNEFLLAFWIGYCFAPTFFTPPILSALVRDMLTSEFGPLRFKHYGLRHHAVSRVLSETGVVNCTFSLQLKWNSEKPSATCRKLHCASEREVGHAENAGMENAALNGYGKPLPNVKSTQRRSTMQ